MYISQGRSLEEERVGDPMPAPPPARLPRPLPKLQGGTAGSPGSRAACLGRSFTLQGFKAGCHMMQTEGIFSSTTYHLDTVMLMKTFHTFFSQLQSEPMVLSALILGGQYKSPAQLSVLPWALAEKLSGRRCCICAVV